MTEAPEPIVIGPTDEALYPDWIDSFVVIVCIFCQNPVDVALPPPIAPQPNVVVYPSNESVVLLYLIIPTVGETGCCPVVPLGSVTDPVPLKTKLLGMFKVPALDVIVSPDALPRVVLPLTVKSPVRVVLPEAANVVNAPELAVVAPMGVLLIVPPVIVAALETNVPEKYVNASTTFTALLNTNMD